MGDDLTIVIPEAQPSTETTPTEELIEESVEELGEELLARLDEIDAKLGELDARISAYDTRLAELGSREFADLTHTHEDLAPADHGHDEYLRRDEYSPPTTEKKERDHPPEKQHPYFRKLKDF